MKAQKLLLSIIIWASWLVPANAQDCNITSKANDILPDKLCAPVTLTWEVTYRGVNNVGTPVQIQVNWDDGNAIEIQTAANTNPALGEWSYTFTHVYPIGGNKCNYRPEASLIVNGVVCTSSIQVQNVTVWDTDNYNGGVLQIDPQIFPICVGNEDGTVFNDVSVWNCTPAGGENDNINGKTRWTQWIYGTSLTLNGVTVGGTSHTYPFSGPIVPAYEYVDAPEPPNNVSQFCNAPATGLVGQFFEVTLRNWNFCNPYDDPSIPGPPTDLINGDFDPIITTAMILVVDTPHPHINPAGPFCANDPQVYLSATPAGGTWAGTGINASGRFRPWVAGPGTHTITYTTHDPVYGCDGVASIQIVVYAPPVPDILPGATAEVCPGDALLLDGNPTAGSGAILSHLWTGDTGPLNFTNIQTPTFLTNTQGLYNLTYTVTDVNGCDASDQIAIGVNPVSAHIIPDPAQVCIGADLILNGNPSGGTGTYPTHVWTGDVSYINVTNTQSVTFNSNLLGTYNFHYQVTDDNGCTGSDDIIVEVLPYPIADAGPNDSVCGLTLNLQAIPSIGTGTWQQIAGPGAITFSNSHSATSQATASQYGLYTLIWFESFGPSCIDTDTVLVRFTEQPIANAGPDGGICGLSYHLQAVASVGTGHWSVFSGAGNLSFSNASLSQPWITSDVYGNYTLVWSEDNGYGCTDADTVLVSFNLVPTPAFNPINPDGCTPFFVQFENLSTGGTDYHWSFGNGNTSILENPNQTFYNSLTGDLTYNVTLIVNNPGCGDTLTQTVTVHPKPFAHFIHDGTPRCSPSTVQFTEQASGSTMHIWNFDDGSPSDTGDVVSHVFVNDTVFIENYAVEMIAVTGHGCTDTAVNYVTVYPNPEYQIVATPDSSCHPATVQFNTAPSGQNYHWSFGNGTSIIGSFQETSQYVNTGSTNLSYPVELIVTSYFGCVDTAQTQIVVHPTPVVDFSPSINSGCAPLSVQFENLSTGATAFEWNFDDGQTDTASSQTLTHVFNNPTPSPITYTVGLIGRNAFGCESYQEKTILVYPEISVEFSADTASCHPFNNQMVNASSGISNFQWTFGDGAISSLVNPSHVYQNSSYSTVAQYQTILRGESAYGCVGYDSLSVSVWPKPISNFNITPESGCTPLVTSIHNLSLGGSSFDWTFGDGQTYSGNDTLLAHTYINSQSSSVQYILQLNVSNAYQCSDVHQQSIEVFPPIVANFTADTAGCHPFSNQMTNNSVGASTYLWTFGDGSTGNALNPVHVYQNTSHSTSVQYQTVLKSESLYGCVSYDTLNITVYPKPVAQFNISQENGCTPLYVDIRNLSQGAQTSSWNYGDGQTYTGNDSLVHHTYTNIQSTAVQFQLQLSVSNAYQCTDSQQQTVEVYPAVDARFVADTSGCSPLPVEFVNQSSGATQYIWDIENGLLSTEEHPNHTYYNNSVYHDTIAVTLIARSTYACADTFSRRVVIFAQPEALFLAAPSTQTYPNMTFAIANQTVFGPWNWSWRFGDGQNSSIYQPNSHTYSTWGVYDIWLKVSNDYCSDSVSHSVQIIAPSPTANFDYSPQKGCVPLQVSLSNLSLNAQSFLWDFGDGSTSYETAPTHYYYEPGTYYIKLTASGENGSDELTLGPIEVYPTPEAHLEVAPTTVYIPDQPIKCYDLSVGADSLIWWFGDGEQSSEQNPLHYYQNEGLYTITLIAMTDYMCLDTAIAPQQVEAKSQGKIDFPNAFKPSATGPSDGTFPMPDTENRVFHPVFRGVNEYELNIFNRWGELIFVSKDLNIGWDGYYRGELCKQDVYVWKAEGKYINGKAFDFAGDVTLLR